MAGRGIPSTGLPNAAPTLYQRSIGKITYEFVDQYFSVEQMYQSKPDEFEAYLYSIFLASQRCISWSISFTQPPFSTSNAQPLFVPTKTASQTTLPTSERKKAVHHLKIGRIFYLRAVYLNHTSS